MIVWIFAALALGGGRRRRDRRKHAHGDTFALDRGTRLGRGLPHAGRRDVGGDPMDRLHAGRDLIYFLRRDVRANTMTSRRDRFPGGSVSGRSIAEKWSRSRWRRSSVSHFWP